MRITVPIETAVDAAIRTGLIDSHRLGLQGHSMGGYVVGITIGQTERFASAVASSGFFDLFSSYGLAEQLPHNFEEMNVPDLRSTAAWVESGPLSLGATPWHGPEALLINSPVSYVPAITTPLLLLQGDLDRIDQASELFTGLFRLKRDAEFVRYGAEGHNISSPANIRDMWERIFHWYDDTLNVALPSSP